MPHPPATQLVRADHRVVGEERAVVDARHRGDEQDGGCLDIPPDARTEHAQPDRGEQARVQREEDRARRVEQSFDASTPASRCGCARGGCPRAARSTARAPRARRMPRRRCPTARTAGTSQTQGARGTRRRGSRHPGSPARSTSPPTANDGDRQQGQRDRRDRVRPEPARRRRSPFRGPARLDAADALGRRSGPRLVGAHSAEHGRAGRDVGALPDPGARRERAAGSDRGVGADAHLADAQDVAVDPVAA